MGLGRGGEGGGKFGGGLGLMLYRGHGDSTVSSELVAASDELEWLPYGYSYLMAEIGMGP